VRHGRTAWNADGRFQGQLDPPLDETGEAQAAAVAPALAAERPALLLTSDSHRAVRTAHPLAALTGLVPRPDPRLREIDLGAWAGLTRDEAVARFPGEHEAWLRGEDVRRGGGETYAEVAERAVAVLTEALTEVPADGVLVAVTHGGTARAALGRLLDLQPGSWWRLAPLGNTRWATLVEASAGWRLVEHGAGLRTGMPAAGPSGSASWSSAVPPDGRSPDIEPARS
jgi:glucosyl-3-phosphoglycerate phosphatase